MKKAIIILLMASLLIAIIGCASSEEEETADIGDEVISLMKMVPKDTGTFIYYNMTALAADSDLEGLYTDLQGNNIFQVVNHPSSRAMFWCTSGPETTATTGFDYLNIVKGDFDTDELRNILENDGFNNTAHNGVEVWESEDECVALMSNDLLVSGSKDMVLDCIGVVKDEEASLYDDSDIKDVMARLPGGIIIALTNTGALSDAEEELFSGLEVSGTSANKKDAYTMASTLVLKFSNGADAEAAKEDIENDETLVPALQLIRDNEYLIAKFEEDL